MNFNASSLCPKLQACTAISPAQAAQVWQGEYSLCLAERIEDVREDWTKLSQGQSIFLQPDYLRCLELAPPEGLKYYYLLIYRQGQVCGLLYCQVFFLDLERSMKLDEAEEKPVCLVKALGKALKRWVSRQATYELLICGNLLLTGPYGFVFSPELGAEEEARLMLQANEWLQAQLQQKGQKVQVLLFKDYPAQGHENLNRLDQEQAFYRFELQPSMLMHLRPEWQSFEDYLGAMSSKYRVRAKRAAKKGKELEKQEFSAEDILANQARIYELYQQIAANVSFNAFTLHPAYFYQLKQQLGDKFRLVVYKLKGEIVAFYTGILNSEELEAHFLGLDPQYNHEYQVYLNVLYDLVKMGLYHRMQHINFARTALEIKSSVGAEPEVLHCYMRHHNRLSNRLLHLIFDYMNPKEEWQPRHPFKEAESQENEV